MRSLGHWELITGALRLEHLDDTFERRGGGFQARHLPPDAPSESVVPEMGVQCCPIVVRQNFNMETKRVDAVLVEPQPRGLSATRSGGCGGSRLSAREGRELWTSGKAQMVMILERRVGEPIAVR